MTTQLALLLHNNRQKCQSKITVLKNKSVMSLTATHHTHCFFEVYKNLTKKKKKMQEFTPWLWPTYHDWMTNCHSSHELLCCNADKCNTPSVEFLLSLLAVLISMASEICDIPKLTLVCWTWICPAFANNVDLDQLASEANWIWSALFVIEYMNLYQQPGSSNLTGWKLEVGIASLFSMAMVK